MSPRGAIVALLVLAATVVGQFMIFAFGGPAADLPILWQLAHTSGYALLLGVFALHLLPEPA